MVEEVPCRIYIESEDPDGLKGVNREKMQKSQMARYKVTKKYSDALENKDQWCIAAVPSYAWAKKVFPNETKNKAYNMLWDAILKTVYVTKDNDPEEAWKNHNADLKSRTAYLNDKKFDYLEYKSSKQVLLLKVIGVVAEKIHFQVISSILTYQLKKSLFHLKKVLQKVNLFRQNHFPIKVRL